MAGHDGWEVEFYADECGREPCREWAGDLSPQKAAAFTAAVRLVLARRGLDVVETEVAVGTRFEDWAAGHEAAETPGKAELRRRFEAAIELGLRFYDARVARGWSQRELSERSGVRQADISRIERGAGNPTEATCSVWPVPLKGALNSYDGKGTGSLHARP